VYDQRMYMKEDNPGQNIFKEGINIFCGTWVCFVI